MIRSISKSSCRGVALALVAVLGLSVHVRADEFVLWASNVNDDPDGSWIDEDAAAGNFGCTSCPCGVGNAARNTGGAAYLWADDFDSFSLPSKHVITELYMNVFCRYSAGESGDRIRVQLRAGGTLLATGDSDPFSSDGDCAYRLGPSNKNDIYDANGGGGWAESTINGLRVGVRRHPSNSPQTTLRVGAIRLRVVTALDCNGDGIPDGVGSCDGACCLTDGTCLNNRTPSECAGVGGVHQGVGTSCGSNSCEGACCLQSGTCQNNRTLGECNASNGVYQGLSSSCGSSSCEGACCLQGGTCQNNRTLGECNASNGVYQGLSSSCGSSSCEGACCLQGGTCQNNRTLGECNASNGVYQGLSSSCGSNSCEGACCLQGGTCQNNRTLGECNASDGVYQGLSSSCGSNSCEGACCLQNGTCQNNRTLGECNASSGVYQGLSSSCGSNSCEGACCLADGSCADNRTAGECASAGGLYAGLDSTCASAMCDQPGACCMPDGSCAQSPEIGGADCVTMGGTYQGDDTTCATERCEGACCFDDGTCTDDQTVDECAAAVGLYQGLASTCAAVTCPGAACCFDDGTCSDESLQADCAAMSGAWMGAGSACVSTVCPGGACCLPDDSCTAGTEADCLTAGGIFRGDGSDCMTLQCPAPGLVSTSGKISNTAGSFVGPVGDLALFGSSIASIGDLDEDGVDDVAVGAPAFLFTDTGAVWVLFLNADGTVKGEVKITEGQNGFVGPIASDDFFGIAVAALGDVDGDGVPDLAVGASSDDGGGSERGALWILFMNSDGTVKAEQKITTATGGFGGTLADEDFFGGSVTALDDLDSDGVVDLAVGAFGDDGAPPAPGCTTAGAVWILFLNDDGTVKAETKIDALPGETFCTGIFGRSVTGIDDLDGDGVADLLVGEPQGSDGGVLSGVAWILFMNSDGTVKTHQKISTVEGNFTGQLDENDRFGISVAWLRDMDGDGVSDVAVGAMFDDDGAAEQGAIWILFLNADGTVKDQQKISALAGGFAGGLDAGDRFGFAVGSVADVNGDGVREVVVGAPGDDDAPPGPGTDFGALWLLFVEGAEASIDFGSPQEYASDGEPIIHDSGDLDGDGDEDIIVVIPDADPETAGTVQVFINLGADGGGGWLGFEEPPLPPITVGPDPTDVVIGQIDGAGGLDAIVTNAGDGTLSILLNNGTPGIFDPPVSLAVGEIPQAIELDDFTPTPGPGGAEDAAVARELTAGGGDLIILKNNSIGGFDLILVQALTGAPKSMEPEDLDDDKNTDLVIGGRDDAFVDVWLQGPAAPGGVITLPVASPSADVAVADFDDNGAIDIASANTGGTVSVILNMGGAVFAPAVEVEVGSDPRSITAADFDIDPDVDPDLAVAVDDPDIGPAVQVLENLSGGEGVDFGPPLALDFNGDPNHVISVDLNGDGAIDLVTVNADDGPSGGSVTARINLPPRLECAGDFSGDGDVGFPDLLALLAAWSPAPGSCVGCPEDLDGDGDVDFQDLLLVLSAWGECL